jgi:hypothetical protein
VVKKLGRLEIAQLRIGLENRRCGESCRNTSYFAAGGKEEHGSSAASRTTGRPAEVLREGSGIKVDGTAGDGLTTYVKGTGNLDWQKTSWA